MHSSNPDTEQNSPSPRRKRTRTRLALLGALALLALLGVRQYGSWHADLERDAMDFVRINGFTNEGYKHNWISGVAQFVLPPRNGRPIAADPLIGVAFPRDRMTNSMAEQLLNIENLDSITLYPADPDGSGVDFGAISTARVMSLRELELPVSAEMIAMLEERFPELRIIIATVPATDAETAAGGDGSE